MGTLCKRLICLSIYSLDIIVTYMIRTVHSDMGSVDVLARPCAGTSVLHTVSDTCPEHVHT